MPLWIITFFLGICSLLVCHALPNLYWLLILFPLGFLCLITFQKTRKIFFHTLIFSLGFFWVLIYTNWVTAWSLSPELESKKILITGYIAAVPIHKSHRVSFEFQTEKISEE